MKIIKTVTGLCLLAMTQTAYADSTITTTVDGVQINKELTKLTFNDKIVTMTFSDNTTETAEMSLVSITLDHSGNSAIEAIIADQSKAKGVYNLKGQYLGESPEGLEPGFYIVDGNKVYVK